MNPAVLVRCVFASLSERLSVRISVRLYFHPSVRPSVCLSVRRSVRRSVHRSVPCYFRMKNVADFRGKKSSNDIIIKDTMSDERVVASYVPRGTCFRCVWCRNTLFRVTKINDPTQQKRTNFRSSTSTANCE